MLENQNDTDWVTFGLIAGFLLFMVIFAIVVTYFATGIRGFIGRFGKELVCRRCKNEQTSKDTNTSEDSQAKSSLDV